MVEYWQRCQALLQWGKIAKNDTADVKINGAGAATAIKYIHRTDGKTNIYFIANLTHQPTSVVCDINISGFQPEIWDPVTKERRDLPQFSSAMGRTSVNIDFDDAQSFFIVFRKKVKVSLQAKPNFPAMQDVQLFTGDWQVTFDPKWGGPASPVTLLI